MEYNALIRGYSGESLKVLARVLVADLKDFPADWLIRYQCKEVDRNTTVLADLCCGPKNPLQIYKPVKNGFPITVRTTEGKTMQLVVSSKDTVKVVKLKIFQLDQSYPPQAQVLYVKQQVSATLRYDRVSLERSGIQPGATLYLNLKSKKRTEVKYGDDFKPINLEATYERAAGQTQGTPEWARYSAGVNLCGDCPNPHCPSKNQYPGRKSDVTIRTSYGEVKVSSPQDEENLLTCPACSEQPLATTGRPSTPEEGPAEPYQVSLKSLLISEARVVMFFKFAGSLGVLDKHFTSERRSSLQEFKFVKGSVDRLEVTTVEPWRSPYCCLKCDTRIMFKKEEFPFICGHVCHSWCRSGVLKRAWCKVCQVRVLTSNSVRDIISAISN